MSAIIKTLNLAKLLVRKDFTAKIPHRLSNTLPNVTVEKSRKSKLSRTRVDDDDHVKSISSPRDYKYVFPEFLPNPEPMRRDRLCEQLERRDMLRRREVIDIPEFYVGSVLAVTVSDIHAPGKKNRFVGICVQRSRHGVRANFTLRNVIDGQGTEIRYDLYSPLVQKIEVLKLEKRLDEELFYLRDAPAEHSTFAFDMEPVNLPPGSTVPLNAIKIKLGPRPWDRRWELKKLKGLDDLGLKQKFYDHAAHPQIAKPWEKHDLMMQYRATITEDETTEIMSEVHDNIKRVENEKLKKRQQSFKTGAVPPKQNNNSPK